MKGTAKIRHLLSADTHACEERALSVAIVGRNVGVASSCSVGAVDVVASEE